MPASQIPTPQLGGAQGGGVRGRPPGGQVPPSHLRGAGSPRRGVGGGGWGTPLASPLTWGVPFFRVWRGEGDGGREGGLPGVGRLSPPRRGRGPTIVLEQKLLYICSRWLVFLHYLSILLFWPRIVKPAWMLVSLWAPEKGARPPGAGRASEFVGAWVPLPRGLTPK